ncbi:hypothetical protein CORC01_10821 [Colletotrichum orchidophilum]|uniref:Uncharacterized protein n=1 Tax=Colletotrichum orchidophilum TaxID=1209926 RepID=A0A1G4AXZ8_9PEZI|nr:uncharacterized protein CORC01_10821 [Colletotrichum orchidophilum]OHE93922.1 hypothetical protein CORC01_10821 [Colletotrichum orchidophilum]
MALQEQMFSGCGNEGPAGHSAQMCPIFLVFSDRYAVNNASRLLAQAAATRSSSTQLTTAVVDDAADSAHAVADEPFHPWVYGFDGPPIPQQEFILENGGDWGVTGESLGPTTVPSSTFPGQITAFNG